MAEIAPCYPARTTAALRTVVVADAVLRSISCARARPPPANATTSTGSQPEPSASARSRPKSPPSANQGSSRASTPTSTANRKRSGPACSKRARRPRKNMQRYIGSPPQASTRCTQTPLVKLP
eukprot:6175814-Pleurochrysis_carterae.AAC.2